MDPGCAVSAVLVARAAGGTKDASVAPFSHQRVPTVLLLRVLKPKDGAFESTVTGYGAPSTVWVDGGVDGVDS